MNQLHLWVDAMNRKIVNGYLEMNDYKDHVLCDAYKIAIFTDLVPIGPKGRYSYYETSVKKLQGGRYISNRKIPIERYSSCSILQNEHSNELFIYQSKARVGHERWVSIFKSNIGSIRGLEYMEAIEFVLDETNTSKFVIASNGHIIAWPSERKQSQ